MTSNPLNSTAASPVTGAATAGSSAGASSIDSMFMELLITQLKNQDPLSPMDPSTFVQQLAQVTSLDQLTQINQLLQNVLGGGVSPTTNSSSGGN